MTETKRYDPAEAEEYGVNEVEQAIDELSEGDHLRLSVSFMTEAAGEQSETFDADVSEIPDGEGRRAELDTPGRRSAWAPPVQADWYIGESATALREDSRIAYGINSMKVWSED